MHCCRISIQILFDQTPCSSFPIPFLFFRNASRLCAYISLGHSFQAANHCIWDTPSSIHENRASSLSWVTMAARISAQISSSAYRYILLHQYHASSISEYANHILLPNCTQSAAVFQLTRHFHSFLFRSFLFYNPINTCAMAEGPVQTFVYFLTELLKVSVPEISVESQLSSLHCSVSLHKIN